MTVIQHELSKKLSMEVFNIRCLQLMIRSKISYIYYDDEPTFIFSNHQIIPDFFQ
jgi:hypothetical protein